MSSKKLKQLKVAAVQRETERKQKRTIVGMVLGWVGVLLLIVLVAVGLRTIQLLPRGELADFLPTDQTLGYVEWQESFKAASWIDPLLPPESSWPQLLKKSEGMRTGGIAFLGEAETAHRVLFLAAAESEEPALQDIIKLNNTRLKGTSYQEYGQRIGRYFALANHAEDLILLKKVREGSEASLKQDPLFSKSRGNLPRYPLVSGYLRSQWLHAVTLPPLLINLSEAIEAMVDHASFAVRPDEEGFQFNTYLAMKPDFLKGQEETRPLARTAFRLTELISANGLTAYSGGDNLSQEWQNTLQTLHAFNPAYAIIFEGLLRTQVKNLFGESVDLRNDIYPLLEGEYAVTLHHNPLGRPHAQLILTHSDPLFAQAKMKKLAEAFRSMAAQFVPKLEVYTLPDGTQSKILVADPDVIRESGGTYEGYSLPCVEIKDSLFGFCYTVTPDKILVSNTLTGLKESIDLTVRPRFILSQYQPFRKSLSRLSSVSDEVGFVDVKNARTMAQAGNKSLFAALDSLLGGLQTITWTKHIFRDGMSAEGYVLMK